MEAVRARPLLRRVESKATDASGIEKDPHHVCDVPESALGDTNVFLSFSLFETLKLEWEVVKRWSVQNSPWSDHRAEE